MLPKRQRLSRVEINEIRNSQIQILQGKFLGLIAQKNSSGKKFTLIVSNKISKKAVERNRIRRLFFQIIEEMHLPVSGLFLFLAKRSIIEANKEDLKKDLDSLFKKLALSY